MSTEELFRSTTQVLWSHLPRQPYQWGHRKITVVGHEPAQLNSLDVPEEWVAPQLRRLVRPFARHRTAAAGASAGSGYTELDLVDRGMYQLVTVDGVTAERFPNTFRCRSCEHFEVIGSRDPIPSCPRGHGKLPQFQWAEIHNCGLLRELSPPLCVRNCHAPMILKNTSQFQVAQWFWNCSKCRSRSDTPVLKFCPRCRSGRVRVIRVAQTSAHYPQHLTVLNPPDRTTYSALASTDVRAAAIGQLIGSVQPGLKALSDAASDGSNDSDPETKVRTAAAALNIAEDHPLYQQLIDHQLRQVTTVNRWRESVDELKLDETRLEAVGDEALALARARVAEPIKIEDLIKHAPSTELLTTYRRYQDLLKKYQFAEITLLQKLPVAHIVAGYTRLSPTHEQQTRRGPVPTGFNFFPSGRSTKFPMYGRTMTTEAMLVRIDPQAVVGWLVDSDVATAPDVHNAESAYVWLLRNLPPITDIYNPPDDPLTAAVLGLVHSMSHRFMKALAVRCGLHIDSLAEYLFPTAAAFLVYANARHEFTLGGIEHVFRYDLDAALTELDADPRCVFDPPCRRSFGGACAACLYTSEVACERFNTELDRNKLFGTLPPLADHPIASSEPRWRAFWRP
ncbi:zinc ribbon domain-containing protein [Nocardia sp. NRRL S-836]|uniref:zinc ribbon domain-containing protein n=1 Tax=Nocardia sp. NRRL S-836 TaxID=1519492 RepID=UPI0006AE644C|nr:zinc ribbon domain-containing protein [Nocardia sp. NRRL S-836]